MASRQATDCNKPDRDRQRGHAARPNRPTAGKTAITAAGAYRPNRRTNTSSSTRITFAPALDAGAGMWCFISRGLSE